MFTLSGFSWARCGVTICPTLLNSMSDGARYIMLLLYTEKVNTSVKSLTKVLLINLKGTVESYFLSINNNLGYSKLWKMSTKYHFICPPF